MSQALNLKTFLNGELVDETTLVQTVVKIGKLKSSHLCLEHDTVARMHAVIEVSGSDVRVIDLGSTAGTFLNRERVEKNAVLKDGDTLTFGPYRIEVGFATAANVCVQVPTSAANAAIELAPAPQSIAPVQRPEMQFDTAQVERQDGATVTEVVAMYGRAVLDVQHVGQVKPRRSSAPMFLAFGGLMMLTGAGAFGYDVLAQDWEGHQQRTQTAAEAGHAPPQSPGSAVSAMGLGLAFLGLVPFCLGLVRTEDKGVPSYTIGEGHHATFNVPTHGLPNAAAFPLVRGGSNGQASLNFTAQMQGDVTLAGQNFALSELVESGRAAASGETFTFPLPSGAHCCVQHGGIEFHVNSVAAGKVIATRAEVDKPFWLFSAGSLVLLGSLLVLSHLAMPDGNVMSLDEDGNANRFVGYMAQPDEEPEPIPVPDDANENDEAGGQGERHAGDEGKMGNPKKKVKSGTYAMKGPKDATPIMARNFDPDMRARQTGILGMMASQSGHILASPHGAAFAVGTDDQDLWGGLSNGDPGEAYGVGGLGLVGVGRGGGGNAEGTLGLGNVGLIGKSAGGGDGLDYGRGSGAGFRTKKKRLPSQVRPGRPEVRGIGKDVVRRIIRAHINEVRHCYNQGLIRQPNLRGRVEIQFSIGPTGRVPVALVSASSLKDKTVSKCIAKAVRRWKFPKPPSGGTVMVKYPFLLNPHN